MRSTSKEIKSMIGQMIMTGFRGTSPEDAASFFQSPNGLTLGSVILYDPDIVKKVYATIMDELLKEGLITAQQIEPSRNRILR